MSAGTAGGAWRDLSNVKITNRLHQRGLGLPLAQRMVMAARGGDSAAIEAITRKLEV